MTKINYKNYIIEIHQYCFELHYKPNHKSNHVKDGVYKKFDDILKRIAHLTMYDKEKEDMSISTFLTRYETVVRDLKTEIEVPVNYDNYD